MTDYNKNNKKQGVKMPFEYTGNITLTQAMEDFPNYLKIEKRSLSTMTAYMTDLNHFKTFMEVKLKNKIRYVNQITTVETMQYKDFLLDEVDEKKIAISTAERRFNCLKTFFKYMGKANYAENTLVGDKFGNKVWGKNEEYNNYLPNYLTTDEIKEIFDSVNLSMDKNKYRSLAILQILANFGCRRSELLNLRWSDIDFFKKTIKIVRIKTCNADLLPLPTNVEKALIKYLKSMQGAMATGYVFRSRTGNKLAKSSFNAILNKCIKQTDLEERKGFKIVPHTFRHSFITYCIQNNFPSGKIIKFTGHRDENSLKIYSHLNHDDVKDISLSLQNNLS